MSGEGGADLYGYLGLARKGGNLVWGRDAVRDAIRSGRAALIVLSADAGTALVRSMTGSGQAAEVPLLVYGTKEEMGRALGRHETAVVAVTDPERSNFKLATERWQLRPEKGGTLLIYEFDMEPDFWVPPVIGPFYIKRALMSGGSRAVERIEALATGREPAPTD